MFEDVCVLCLCVKVLIVCGNTQRKERSDGSSEATRQLFKQSNDLTTERQLKVASAALSH